MTDKQRQPDMCFACLDENLSKRGEDDFLHKIMTALTCQVHKSFSKGKNLHYKIAARYRRLNNLIGSSTLVVSVLVTFLTGLDLQSENLTYSHKISLASASFSLFLTMLSAASVFLKLGQKADEHTAAAKAYYRGELESKTYLSEVICRKDLCREEWENKHKKIEERLNELHAHTPVVPEWAHKQYKKDSTSCCVDHIITWPGKQENH